MDVKYKIKIVDKTLITRGASNDDEYSREKKERIIPDFGL